MDKRENLGSYEPFLNARRINLYANSNNRWNDCPVYAIRASELKKLSYKMFEENLKVYLFFCKDMCDKIPFCTIDSNIYLGMKLWLTQENCTFFIGVREENEMSWLEVAKVPDRQFDFEREVPEQFDMVAEGELANRVIDDRFTVGVAMNLTVPHIEISLD